MVRSGRPYRRRYAIGERRGLKIRDHHLRTVAFLCIEKEIAPGVISRIPIATAFFVVVQEGAGWLGYVVTARHCVDGIGSRPLYLRVNVEDGFDDIETRREDWYMHDDADVAVAPFVANRPGGFVLNAVGLEDFVNADYSFTSSDPTLATYVGTGDAENPPLRAESTVIPVEPGNDVFFVGLFVQHYGEKQNLPVARFGNISRMPIEPITFKLPDGTYSNQLAYLVESRSWGGHSGSPVYWRHPIAQLVELDAPRDAPKAMKTRRGTVYVQYPGAEVVGFLGLVSGHFDIDQEAKTVGDVQGSITTGINSGIAVVTPAEAVRELLMREDVVDHRKGDVTQATSSAEEKRAVTLDSLGGGDDEFSRFETLAKNLLGVSKTELDELRRGEQA